MGEGPLREHELTGVVGRAMFEDPPPDAHPDDLPRWRAFRKAYHAAARLDAVAAFPLQLDFELNTTCQMRCTFCAQTASPPKLRLMTFDTFATAIREGEAHGLCSVKLNVNNEPLLRRDLPRFVRFAKAHSVLNTYIATNGLALGEVMAREIIASGLTKVMVSLDATTAATYRQMRNSTQFGRIVANVRHLIELRDIIGSPTPLVRVNFLRTEINKHEADDFLAEWTGIADGIGFQEQLGVPGVTAPLSRNGRPSDPEFRCAFPFKMVALAADGDIRPCCPFSGVDMPLGNLADMTIKEAWDSDQMATLREMHRAGLGLVYPSCEHCQGADAAPEIAE